MGHFAKIGPGNIVENVIVADDGSEAWLESALGGRWLQTSFTGSMRGNYAGIGYTYDEDLDAFIPPKPSETAVLDEVTFQWVEPNV